MLGLGVFLVNSVFGLIICMGEEKRKSLIWRFLGLDLEPGSDFGVNRNWMV